MSQDVLDERNIGFDTSNSEFIESSIEFLDGLLVSSAFGNNLGQERIVVWRDDHALMTLSIESDTQTTWGSENTDSSRIWLEAFFGVFGGDSTLDSISTGINALLLDTQFLEGCTSSDQNLCLDDINTSGFFSDGVLNLNSWVDFDEVESTAVVFKQEFNRTSIFIINMFTELDGRFEHLLAELWIDS